MKAAIAYLEQQLEVLTTNEPIHRSEGNIEQADLAASSIVDIKQAIRHLHGAPPKPIFRVPSSFREEDAKRLGEEGYLIVVDGSRNDYEVLK